MSTTPQLKQQLKEIAQLTGKVNALEQYVAQTSSVIAEVENSKAYKLKGLLTRITKKLGVYYRLLVMKYYTKHYFLRFIHHNGPLDLLKATSTMIKFVLQNGTTFIKLFLNDRDLFYLYFSHSVATLKEISIEVSSKKITQATAFVDIVIPWYGDPNIIKLILSLKNFDRNFIKKIILINDAYPDETKTTQLFQQLKQLKFPKLIILRNQENLGFIGTVNRGMKFSKHDVVLLNSDTVPTNNWIDELRLAAYSGRKVATATALSSNATIFSLQHFNEPYEDKTPGLTAEALAALAPTHAIQVPTAHGFCMYIRRSILKKFGYFDAKRYGKGYCEENDFSMRVHKAGYSNVAATRSYVAHLEAQSFGNKKRLEQLRTNYQKLLERYPEYQQYVADCLHDGKLRSFQNSMNFLLAEWKKRREYVLLINHSNVFSAVGGVERTTFQQISMLRKQKAKHVLLYFYDDQQQVFKLMFIKHGLITALLSFDKNSKPLEILKWIVSAFKVRLVIANHLMKHSPKYFGFLNTQKIQTVLFIHDYYYLFGTPDLLEYQQFAEPLQTQLLTKQQFRLKAQFLAQPEKIIFNSEFTRAVYEKFLGQLNNAVVSYPDQLTT